jgi:glucosamine-6-phosphate isomerase
MKEIIYNDYSELSVKTAELIADIISHKPDALLCFPAGETSVGTFACLIELNKSGIISFKNIRIVGLDEWIGLREMKTENCFSFLQKHLFDHIDYTRDNLCFFDGESDNTEQECTKTDDFINQYGPIDMVLLGIGMNGHLGLNEPGTSWELDSHVVRLDETTKRVGQKYFSKKTELTSGITLGMKQILKAKTVILQVSGKRKAEVVEHLKNSYLSGELPASALIKHTSVYLLLDREAAGLTKTVDCQKNDEL